MRNSFRNPFDIKDCWNQKGPQSFPGPNLTLSRQRHESSESGRDLLKATQPEAESWRDKNPWPALLKCRLEACVTLCGAWS